MRKKLKRMYGVKKKSLIQEKIIFQHLKRKLIVIDYAL